MNLLKETIAELNDNNVTIADVRWVGNHEGWCTWHEFSVAATNINYDAGYGTEWINTSLVIVGDDWWMERHNYDGSEWWEFKRLPKRPDQHRTINSLLGTGRDWRTMKLWT